MANTDYLRFDAESMREYIIANLLETGDFSDGLFRGSNIAVLVELFSYMYDALTYQINYTATEAMFTEAEFYDNMNRIVKMLGYNPSGVVTSQVEVDITITPSGDGSTVNGISVIPKYATYTTSKTNDDGDAVKYTFVDSHSYRVGSSVLTSNNKATLVNGTWKLHKTIMTTSGIPFETMLLDLDLSTKDRIYLAHGYIDVYVKDNGKWTKWESTSNLYDDALSADYMFEYRLNENKQYELKFGNDIMGKRLPANAELYVVYLQSDASKGILAPSDISEDNPLSIEIEGFKEDFIIGTLLGMQNSLGEAESPAYFDRIRLHNSEESTPIKDFETVEEIRDNAPNAFRKGSRLITANDFEEYILNTYNSNVYDLVVMNNWQYMSEFLSWCDTYGKLNNSLRNNNYEFADSCDFNNVYLWMKSYGVGDVIKTIKRQIELDINRKKALTAEVVFVDSLGVKFTPYVSGYDKSKPINERGYYLNVWDVNNENQIEITRSRNSMVSNIRIKQLVSDTIKSFFLLNNNKLGQVIELNSLYNSIMAINGVEGVKTRYIPNGTNNPIYEDGLSFAYWTDSIIDGADFTKISGNLKLNNFQFPVINTDRLMDMIEVKSEEYNMGGVEY